MPDEISTRVDRAIFAYRLLPFRYDKYSSYYNQRIATAQIMGNTKSAKKSISDFKKTSLKIQKAIRQLKSIIGKKQHLDNLDKVEAIIQDVDTKLKQSGF